MTTARVCLDPNRRSLCRVGSALIAAGTLLLVVCPLSAQNLSVQADASAEPVPASVEPVVADSIVDAAATSPNGLTWQSSPQSSPPANSSSSPAAQPSQPQGTQQQGLPDAPKPAAQDENGKKDCKIIPCPTPIINWYLRFQNGPQVKPMTPKEKAWLATRNLIDPFNLIIIAATSGISVAADSHSPYGPGWPGFGRNVGVAFTEDMTAEFFGTFLIPSIVHQDPHYHRMPQARYPRRIFHAITQVVWTQGDNGKGMLNYANLAGLAIDDEIANLYVPGRQTNSGATAQRYAIGLATSPIDNFLIEFLPDVARRIHVQVVVVQRIINHVASRDSGGF
jgi:hypothetical protein